MDLSTNFYEPDILSSLTSSRNLIVVCTSSRDLKLPTGELNWQQREITDFLAARPEGSIIPVVVDGTIDSSPLPCALDQKFPKIHRIDGRSFRKRWWRARPLILSALREEVVDIAGGVRSVSRDKMELLHRLDARARLRNAVALVMLAALIAIGFAVLSFVAVNARTAQRTELVRSLTRQGAIHAQQAPTSAALLFARAIELAGEDSKLDEPARMWLGLLDDFADERLFFHGSPIRAAAIRATGDRIATGSEDGSIHMWTLDGNPVATMHHEKGITSLQFSPTGALLASTSWDGTVRLWDGQNGTPLRTMKHDNAVNLARFHPNGDVLVSAGWDDKFRVWGAKSGEELKELPSKYMAYAIDFDPKGRTLITGDHGGSLCIYASSPTALNGARVSASRTATSSVRSSSSPIAAQCATSPSRPMDSACSQPATMAQLGCGAWRRVTRDTLPFDHLGGVFCAMITPDGRAVLTCGADGVARLRPIASRSPRVADIVDEDEVNSPMNAIAFDANRGLAIVANNAGHVFVHRLDDGSRVASVSSNELGIVGVDALVTDPAGTKLAVVGGQGPVRIFSQGDWKAQKAIGGGEDYATSAAFSADGSRIVVGYQLGEVQAFKVADGSGLFPRTTPARGPAPKDSAYTARTQALAVAPTGTYFVSGHQDGGVHVWTFDGEVTHHLAHAYDVKSVAISHDGLRLLTAGGDGKAKLWDPTQDFSELRTIDHGGPIASASFSPDGTSLVTAGDEHTAALWSVASGDLLIPRLRHAQNLWFAEISNGGRAIVTASQDATAQVWDAELAEPIGMPLRHRATVSVARFSPDGRYVVTAGFDGRATIWRVPRYDGAAAGVLARIENESGLKLDAATQEIRVEPSILRSSH